MKKFCCLVCLLVIASLSMVYASSEDAEPNRLCKNALYLELVPQEEQEEGSTFKIINVETGYEYSSIEEFYTEERNYKGVVEMDLVNQSIYLIPEGQK